MKIPRPAKQRAADIAYERIRASLLEDRWPAGTHLKEAELSAEMRMSRTPVRDALRRLAAESLIGFEPHLGATVQGWTRHDIDEIFLLRVDVEGMAAELAAANATAEQLDTLEKLAATMIEVAEHRDERIGELTAVNERFHHLIVEASRSRRVARMVELVTELPIVVRTFAHYDDRAMRRSVAHHVELVEALRARDGVWAKAIMQAHLRAGRAAMLNGLRQEPARKSDNENDLLYTTNQGKDRS